MLPSSSALVGGPRHGGVLQPVQASAAPQVPPETASRVAALCNTSSTLFDTEGAHAPPASPQLAMPDPAHAASGAVALQEEVEALHDECKQLESVTVSMRAAMLTLVTEVDALGVADKRAESELNAAKARATLASQRVGRARPMAGRDSGLGQNSALTSRHCRRTTRRRLRTTRNCSRTSCRLRS